MLARDTREAINDLRWTNFAGAVAREDVMHRALMRPAPTSYLPSLEMLRGVAALAVVFHHVAQQVAGEALAASAGGRLLLWLGGWGVMVFFVLSGCCIHGSMLKEDAAPNWRRYFARRTRRILPGYGVALVLSTMVGLVGTSALITPPTATALITHLTFTSSFTYETVQQINCVLWTVVVEVHFYAVYPVFLWLRKRLGMGWLVVALLGLSLMIKVASRALLGDQERWVWHHLFANLWWIWAVGAWLAEVKAGRVPMPWVLNFLQRRVPAILIVIASLLVGTMNGSRWATAWLLFESYGLPVLCAGVVSAAMFSPWQRWQQPMAEALGRWSYSLYLFHPLAIWLCWQLMPMQSPVMLAGCMVTLSVALAAMGWRCVEGPFQVRR